MEESRYVRLADLWNEVDALFGEYFYPRIARLGLGRGQGKMLRFLKQNPGCRQKDIADRFYLRAASVSGVLATMERSGLLERRINPKSRREILIFLTEHGEETLRRLEELYREMDERVFSDFPEEEFLQLLNGLELCKGKAVSLLHSLKGEEKP